MKRIRTLLIVLLALWGSVITPLSPSQAQESPRDPRFGAVEAFWDTQAAVEAGVAWERILFYWSQLQPHGPDDWNTLHVPDEWLQWADGQGREVVGLLKNTPAWAADADPPLESSPPRGLDLPVDDPGNLWAAFVRRAVSHYGPRGVHRWIIWNEPDIQPGVYGEEWGGSVEQYYRLLKVAYLVIKEVDPGASVHLAGLTFWHDPGWLREFLAVATADPDAPAHNHFFDTVSLHIYFQTDTVDYIVNEARAALAAYGLVKPIWINETNASPDADPLWPLERPRWRVDLREQASFILQAYALGLAAGAERIAVYKLVDSGLPPGGEPFGLLRPDHSRRPAYTAYRLVTQHYAGARSVRIVRDPLWARATLDRGERATRIFWARTAAEVSLTVPALAAQALLIDQEGNEQILDGSGGSYTLTLPGARCVDEYAGCFIGGPTYLLVEEAPAGEVGAPGVERATPTAEATATAGATSTSTGAVLPTSTASATPTPPPTATSARPAPSSTATTSPTVPPSATPVMIANSSVATQMMASPPPPLPSLTLPLIPSPTPPARPDRPGGNVGYLFVGGMFGIVGLVGVIGLIGFALWKRQNG